MICINICTFLFFLTFWQGLHQVLMHFKPRCPSRGEKAALSCAALRVLSPSEGKGSCVGCTLFLSCLQPVLLAGPAAQLRQRCCWRWDCLLVVRDHPLHQTSGLWCYRLFIGNLLSVEEGFAYKNHHWTCCWSLGQENHSALCISKPPQTWLLLRSRADNTREITKAFSLDLFHARNYKVLLTLFLRIENI